MDKTDYSQYNICFIDITENLRNFKNPCLGRTSPENLSTSKQMSSSVCCIGDEILWVLEMFLSSKIVRQNRAIGYRVALDITRSFQGFNFHLLVFFTSESEANIYLISVYKFPKIYASWKPYLYTHKFVYFLS